MPSCSKFHLFGSIPDIHNLLGKGNYEYAIPIYGERRPILVDLLFSWDADIAKKYSFIKKDGDMLYTETDASCINGTTRGEQDAMGQGEHPSQ